MIRVALEIEKGRINWEFYYVNLMQGTQMMLTNFEDSKGTVHASSTHSKGILVIIYMRGVIVGVLNSFIEL